MAKVVGPIWSHAGVTIPDMPQRAAVLSDLSDAAQLQDPGLTGRYRVVGGPGTGKSRLLIDIAAAHIVSGADPESVLLLTGSGRLATSARGSLTAALLKARANEPCRAVIREPLIRSIHSYAFGVLRHAATRAGDPPPRLITGAEHDSIIRELLAGDLIDGDRSASRWPDQLRPALGTEGFATELRDLLARCAERGVDPLALQRIGRQSGRAEWAAAGRFAQQFEQVMLLRAAVGTAAPQASVPALGAAEMVGAALEAFATDPDLLSGERARVRVLLVDDAQHLDPQAALLVRVLAAGAYLTVIAGDPAQAVFGFRGADPEMLVSRDTPALRLTRSYRCAPAVAAAIGGIASGLPGAAVWQHFDGTAKNGEDIGSVVVRAAATTHDEAALIADTLRRAHLLDDVPWSQMCVIVRSVSIAAALPRVLAGAGVPVAQPAVEGPISDHPAARALLTVLRATLHGLDDEGALALLTGPIGRVDPVSLRQLRRTLVRAAADGDDSEPTGSLLVKALAGAKPSLPKGLAAPVKRVRSVLAAAQRGYRQFGDPRHTLWLAWERSGLQRRWLTIAERGTAESGSAERNLGAVTALFDIADAYVTRTTGASLSGFLDHVAGLQLAPVLVESGTHSDTVAVVSPHAALGRDWQLVVIAGLQDGLWPNTTPRGGVLGTQRLLDVLDGVGGDASSRAPLLAEERRLLVAAMGRARHRLVVTAVDSESSDDCMLPSPFFDEIARWATVGEDSVDSAVTKPIAAPPVLSAAAVVGRLRSIVCAPAGSVDENQRNSAAVQLARLVEAGVPGADPSGWEGLLSVSTEDPLWEGDDHTALLSPSTLQTLSDCPLRWMVEKHGGTDRRELGSVLGSVLHALVADSGKSAVQLTSELENIWEQIPFDSSWHAANELDRYRAMLMTFLEWRSTSRDELTEVATEIDLEALVADPGELPGVRMRGRVDRLERDADGRLVIVDVKTGKSPVTKAEAVRHAQLAFYQLAIASGASVETDQPGGGRLVYVGKQTAAGAAERIQPALTPEACEEWRDTVQHAAAQTAGPRFVARVNGGCGHCPMRRSCPAQQQLGTNSRTED